MRGRRRWVIAAALCFLAVSCGNSESLTEIAGAPSSTTETALEDKSERSAAEDQDDSDDDGTFDPANWNEPPKWWPEVKEIYDRNPDLLTDQDVQWVETPPSDAEASEMHLGDRVLEWRVPVDWVEVCISHGCVYAWGDSELGTHGFVAGWGGEKGRTWSRPPGQGSGPRYQGHQYQERPRAYVAGDTQPLGCEPNKEKSDPEAVDLYPEPWFVACVGAIDDYTIARVEMFRLNEDCEPYGNSYGAWISWEWASATNINLFVTSLAIQMLADRIECVSLETLLSTTYGYGYDDGDFWGLDNDLTKIWVSELQRRIGADVDGLYGPQTQDLHFRAAKNTDSFRDNIPLISSTPCGTFKLLPGERQWEALEGLIVEWDRDEENWLQDSAQLEPPGKVEAETEVWWEDSRRVKGGSFLYPPPPSSISTADVTGDGANDFVMVWSGTTYSTTAIATNHKRSTSCEQWRYIDEPTEMYIALYPTDHDVWLATAKTIEDSQGNRCQSPGWNASYQWYDPDIDDFHRTMCMYYPKPND